MRLQMATLACGIFILATAGCSRPQSTSTEPKPHIPAHWSYEGGDGPARWGKLDPEYANCGFGTIQSPVDIAKTEPQDLPNIEFHYQPSKLRIQNTGHAIQMDVAEGNSIDVNGESYELTRLEIHVPSEHRVHGKLADAELQLVHRNAAGQLAIVAILLRIGSDGSELGIIWDNLPLAPAAGVAAEKEINLEKLLPMNRQTWRYEGSLTTPPCAEIVSWLVMRDAMPVSVRQLADFTRSFGHNNRPVQPLNQRTILLDSSPR